MREWLSETRGPSFELFRHFLLRFFDTEGISLGSESCRALIAAVSLCLPWFQVFYGPIKQKYAYLSALPLPGPYRDALRADELWLITLLMSLIGLLTVCKWQSLFPGLRDYRALGALPLRPRHIFLAKLLALLLVAAGAVALLNALPAGAFPALSAGRWAFHGPRAGAYALASITACGFLFFALLALQGLLLNFLRPRAFGRLTGHLQGLLVAVMLALLVLSFSIGPRITNVVLQPAWSRWLPPVWFLGLCQSQSGDPDPLMHMLARRAVAGLFAAVILALGTYAATYHRHRALLMEGPAGPRQGRRAGFLLDRWIPDPRQHAVIGFMLRTLSRGSHHRMILMGYAGLAFAVLSTAVLGMGSFVGRERFVLSAFLYFHVIAIVFLLIGARHLFSLPVELKANWLFQITESEGRTAWLRAVDRFLLFWGALVILLPLPVELRALGARGAGETALACALGLLAYDWTFSSWNKLPFTCSHLPGKTPGWILALRFFALIMLVPIANALLLAAVSNVWALAVVLLVLIAAWTRVHALRRESWPGLRFQYEELPEPPVDSLHLLRQ